MRLAVLALAALAAATGLVRSAVAAQETMASYGIAIYGDLKYGRDFTHFDYADPEAPKGGTVRYPAIGTFDTLNPFQLKGVKADGLGLIFDTLMSPSADEPASEYGLVAESAEIAPDRSSVTFHLRKEARFADGSAITPEDVVWTFDTLKAKGNPSYRLYYADVLTAEKAGEREVKFSFRTNTNRELSFIVGSLPVLSKAYWEKRDFEKTTLEPPLGSGPYKIESFDVGRSITYRRVADYWGKDLPVNRGRDNFDTIRYDYYRDSSVALEAFKAGQYDIRQENVAKNWATGYDTPALREGLFLKEEIPNQVPRGMQAFGYNTRHPLFANSTVRKALGYLFDFEWTNKNLFYGEYVRTKSYFSNSDLASSGLPSPEELKILEPYRGQIPDEVFTTPYEPATTDGSGNIRPNMREALRLLKEGGWSIKDERLINDQTGQPFEFEMLLGQPEFERVVLPFAQNLARIGVKMNVRTIDPAQYENRVRDFDFDMTVVAFPESLTPGNEQRDFWGSAAVDEPGSANLLGIRSKAVDALVDLVINSPDRPSLVTRVHALDRVLLHSHCVIPNWHITKFRVALWNKFGRPKVSPPYALALDTWWIDPKREAALEARKTEERAK
jgi:microcin C transport system substrate-binding protein